MSLWTMKGLGQLKMSGKCNEIVSPSFLGTEERMVDSSSS